ncbi:hypothetical protein JOB18_045994 [Solea senegalensis]|uniref:Uncharacterized protein n=1 Tax=Solea senegalensis TaxID=28829 RepID=A0AAV6R3R8_SOLSE|nr:hypothetical protein JOB18_045994 [Solea senegalensis]
MDDSVPKDEWSEGGRMVVCVDAACSFAPPPFQFLRLFLLPPPLSLHQPLGSVWLIKEEEAGNRHGAVCLDCLPRQARKAGQRVSVWSSPDPTAPPTTTFVSSGPLPLQPPSRKPFCGDETVGAGWAGLRIRIRLARVEWQMAA